MTTNIDPNEWLVGCDPHGNVSDLFPTLFAGGAAAAPKRFHQTDAAARPRDANRIALLQLLKDHIQESPLAPTTKYSRANKLKRFVKWADANGHALTRDTVTDLVFTYEPTRKLDRRELISLIASAIILRDSEREQLGLGIDQLNPFDDQWILKMKPVGRGTRRADFLRLVVPGSAGYTVSQWRKKRYHEKLRLEQTASFPRQEYIESLLTEFCALANSGMADSSLNFYFNQLRHFVIWCDDNNHELNTRDAPLALQQYSAHLTAKWRAGILSSSRAYDMLDITPLIANASGLQSYQLKGRLSVPRSRSSSGYTSKRINSSELQTFCFFLHEVIRNIPASLISTPHEKDVSIAIMESTIDLPVLEADFLALRADPRIQNHFITTIRVWAELHRFIALTGANLSPALQLTIGDWKESKSDIITAFKARAQKEISLRIANKYARHLDAHVGFLDQALPLPLKDEMPLFPRLRFNAYGSRATLALLHRGALVIEASPFNSNTLTKLSHWARSQGVKVYGSRQLRLGKAEWTLIKYKGDSLAASRALGNTPQVTHASYGGKGNLTRAQIEWSRHWEAEPQLQSALAPGRCSSPGHHEPLSNSSKGRCTDSACVTCAHYRGEDHIDYIHRMLTFQCCVALRAHSNQQSNQTAEAIDLIVNEFEHRHPELVDVITTLRHDIYNSPHPRFATMLRIAEIQHA